MQAELFLDFLEKAGYNFFTGVPCSYFTSLCSALAGREKHEKLGKHEKGNKPEISFHVPAVREDIAVGLASGAYLAGKNPVVYMQNSGLGYSLEAFTSLPMIYRIPLLVLASYRGPQDQGMEEHLVMGEHTEELLSTFRINYAIFDGSENPSLPVSDNSPGKDFPFVLLVTKGALT